MLRLRFVFAVFLCCLSLQVKAEGVTIFAAASLKTALDEITDGTNTTISYAASSTIARQIELGAPADLVITASSDWMDHLEAANRLEPGTRVDLLGNQLVLIAPADMMFIAQADRAVDEIVGGGRIAMALVEAVPAGIYGKEALGNLGVWDALSAQIIQTDNVRAALRLVAMGEVAFGIVYASDVDAEERVQTVYRFASGDHRPILYPMAMIAGADRPDVRRLWSLLQSPKAAKAFSDNAFLVLGRAQ